MEDLIGQIKESLIDAVILPLHGELEYHEQRRCFYNYPRPKVIISTPIAQTSVTIPGIDTVVDTGKAIIPTAKNGVMFFDELDVSQADLKQRMKRAGRIVPVAVSLTFRKFREAFWTRLFFNLHQ